MMPTPHARIASPVAPTQTWQNSNASFLAMLGLILMVAAGHADEPLARRATWHQPTAAQVKTRIEHWLEGRSIEATVRAKVDALWASVADSSLLDTTVSTLALGDPGASKLVTFCRRPRTTVILPRFAVLRDPKTSEFAGNNLRLLYGRWLMEQRLYNEAWEQLQGLEAADVVDPASLLFCQSAVCYRLLEKEKALAAIGTLLENEETIPRRYATVARLMQMDLRPLKPDSLDEVARLMDSIHVRLGHGRAGRRVRKEEDDVVAKLDKMIKKLEEQAKKSRSAGSMGSQLQPSKPMQDSNPGGGTGPGNVDPKRFARKYNWGNLPPKQRQEALQQLGKEYPSYYREVIEEYFRKLARDDSAGQP